MAKDYTNRDFMHDMKRASGTKKKTAVDPFAAAMAPRRAPAKKMPLMPMQQPGMNPNLLAKKRKTLKKKEHSAAAIKGMREFVDEEAKEKTYTGKQKKGSRVGQKQEKAALKFGSPEWRKKYARGASHLRPGSQKKKKPLTAKARTALPASDFAGPKRSYPINDKNHARNALARVSQFGSAGQKARVRGAVKRKFPAIGK